MPDISNNLEARREGCKAEDSLDPTMPNIPVCMGGTAILGCNHPEDCVPLYRARIDDPRRQPFIYNNKVDGVIFSLNDSAMRQILGIDQ